MRRFAFVGAVVLAATLALAQPASADTKPAVTVVEVSPAQVRMVASVPGTGSPEVTVTRDGYLLTATVRADQPALPADTRLRTAVVVLDTSASMAGAALRTAQDAVNAFTAALPADVAVGVVTTGGTPAVLVRPTRDRETVRAALATVRASGGFALHGALRLAADLGTDAGQQRIVVVSGDRDATDAPGTVVRDLTAPGRQVDLLPIGTPAGALDEVRRLVSATGGAVRQVSQSGALAGTFPPLVTITVVVPEHFAGTTATLTVTTGTGAARSSTDVEVRFAPAPEQPALARDSGLPGLPTPQPGVLAGLVFAGLLLALLLFATRFGESTRKSRLRQVEQFRLGVRGTPVTGRTVVDRPVGGFGRSVGTPGPVTADGPAAQPHGEPQRTLSSRKLLLIRIGLAVLGLLLFGAIGKLIGAVLGALLGWLLGTGYPRLRERRRRNAFADQLPDALQLIVGSLRSGFSLAQAIDGVVQDSPTSVLTVEFGRAIAEVRLGADLDDALERVAQRVGNDDLAWAVMAVRIQRETGGNLAEVLETTVETLRERDRLRRHVQALSAEGRLSAYILIGLPFALAGWLLVVRREYLSILWTTSAGLTMLVGAAVLMVIGIFWMMRWMKVEV